VDPVTAAVGSLTGSREWLVVALAGIVGLFIGSFLNVVVYRAPLGLSVSSPRSFCPTCDRQLVWWENVPLVSWLALRGRCHTCHEPISVRYPLVEAATAIAFAFVAWGWHGSLITPGYCVLAATAISIGLIEYGGNRSPLSVGAIGVAIGEVLIIAASAWLGRWPVLGWSLAGLVVGTLAFALLRMGDPDCRDPRWQGRTLLPVAGCWLGGLGGAGTARYAVAGLAAWILAEFACLLVIWSNRDRGHRIAASGVSGAGATSSIALSIASLPLVAGVLVALVVSLTIAG
jgi:leader peptidase (prepilin peptidase)/N-methyltransferase